MRNTREILANLAIVIASTLVCLLLVESVLYARLVYQNRNSPSVTVPRKNYLYGLKPGAVSTFSAPEKDGGYSVKFSINSAGYREPEIEESSSSYRVMVYGDSFIEGDYSAQEHTFVAQLDKQFKLACREDIEVINAGVRGYGPDQVYLRLRDELPKFKPDLVIVAVYVGNDFGDLIRNQLFKLDQNSVLVQQSRELVSNKETRFGYQLLSRFQRLADSSPGRPNFVDFRNGLDLEKTLEELEFQTAEYEKNKDRNFAEIVHLTDFPDIDIALKTPGSRYKIELMQKILGEIKDLFGKYEVPGIILVIPDPVLLGNESFTYRYDPDEFPNFAPEAPTSEIAAICSKIGLPFLNLYPLFLNENVNELYFKSHDHWNNNGQRLAAKLVSEKIIESDSYTVINESLSCSGS